MPFEPPPGRPPLMQPPPQIAPPRQQQQQQQRKPMEFSVPPLAAGANPRTGLNQAESKDWMSQPAYGKPTAENPGPAHDPGSNAWGQVKDAVKERGGLDGEAINSTISNAIRSGDKGRVSQALKALGLDDVNGGDLVGHYNSRVASWKGSDAGKQAAQDNHNRQIAEMSRAEYQENYAHPQLRERMRSLNRRGYATPHVASRGTTHYRNWNRPAFIPHGTDSEGNVKYKENRRLHGTHRDTMGNWHWD